MQSANGTEINSSHNLAPVPGLPRFDLPFVFTIIHRIRRSAQIIHSHILLWTQTEGKNWGGLGTRLAKTHATSAIYSHRLMDVGVNPCDLVPKVHEVNWLRQLRGFIPGVGWLALHGFYLNKYGTWNPKVWKLCTTCSCDI